MKSKPKKLLFGHNLLPVVASLLSLIAATSVYALGPCDRQPLAIRIRDNTMITLDTYHPSGVVDNANARQNIVDTANGLQAHNSCYGNAPCGMTWLDPRMLSCMDQLANVYGYTYSVTELCGGSHSVGSWHYYGRAVDVWKINGVVVDGNNPYVNAFIQHCYDMGANYAFLENNDHVHSQWADDGGNVAPSGCTPPPSYSAFVGPIVANADGRLEMFGIGSNSDVWHNYQTAPNSSWNGWLDMANGNSIAGPAVSHDKDGRLELFASTGSGKVWHNFQVIGGGGAWNGWGSQGGPSVTNLVPLINADGRIELFGIGSNGDVWHEWQTSANGAWTTTWSDITGLQVKSLVGIANEDGRLEIFGVAANGNVWHNWQSSPGQNFNGWANLSGNVNPRLSIAKNCDGRVEVFGIGTDGAIWHNWQKTAGQVFNGWSSLAGSAGILPGFAVGMNSDGRLEIIGGLSDTSVWHTWQTQPGGNWHAWSSLGGSMDPQFVVGNNKNGDLQIFGIGTGSKDVWTIYQTTPGGSWGNWFSMGGNGTKFFYGQP